MLSFFFFSLCTCFGLIIGPLSKTAQLIVVCYAIRDAVFSCVLPKAAMLLTGHRC